MKEARYLVRLSNQRSLQPHDGNTVLTELRTQLRGLPLSVMNLRISRYALEFDVFCDPAWSTEELLNRCAAIGQMLTCRRLDNLAPVLDPHRVSSEAADFFREERFWEAHEVLEGLWKIRQGEEKRLLQGIILTAAALVHEQKNENAVVPHLLKDALERLEASAQIEGNFPVADLRRWVKHRLSGRPVETVTNLFSAQSPSEIDS